MPSAISGHQQRIGALATAMQCFTPT